MTVRVSFLVLMVAILVGSSVLVANEKRWDPATAVSDARRDIANDRIRFCFIGGFVPHPIGVPDDSYAVVLHYPRIAVGYQGCEMSKHRAAEHEYARLYNEEMWRYVSKKRR
jgi:hypothetical protein